MTPTASPVSRFDGVTQILIATMVAGAIGYVVTAVAARGLGAADYAVFAVFWGALYLLVGSLSGIQQELTRASSPGPVGATGMRDVARFAVGIGILTFIVVLGVGLLVAPHLFGSLSGEIALALAVGIAFNSVVVAYSGVTYGLAAWRVVAIVIVLDVVLRLIAVVVALAAGWGAIGLAWASVIPYPFVLAFLLFATGGRHRRPVRLDVGLAALSRNVARTIGASVGMAVLVSGFPLLIGLARGEADDASVGVLVFALILTRAPIVVSVLGLQSYFVARFRNRTGRRMPLVLAAVSLAGGLLALAAWMWGSQLVAAVAGEEFAVPGELLAGLVLASIPTAWLTLSGAVVLAHGRHLVYVAGWTVAAAIGALLIFLAPGDLETRTLVAMSAGPVVGFAVHAAGTILEQRRADAT